VRVPGAAQAALLAIIAASSTSCTHAVPTGPSGSTAASAIATPASNPASPAPANSPASLRTCPASQLTIKLIYGGPAAGTIGGVIGFSNHSSTRCQLAGWPTLAAAGPARRVTSEHTLSVFAGPTLTRPPVVTIKPGTLAVAVLAGSDHPGPGSAKCPPPYHRLLVAPPGSTRATAISAWIPNFDAYLPACTPIRISPVIPASDLPFLPLQQRTQRADHSTPTDPMPRPVGSAHRPLPSTQHPNPTCLGRVKDHPRPIGSVNLTV
jgi:hypothetical protein